MSKLRSVLEVRTQFENSKKQDLEIIPINPIFHEF